MGYQNLVFDKESVFLVTGGAGFIGSNLCEAILNLGYTVRCLDNLPYASMLGTVCIVYIELRSVFENLKEKRSSAVEILEIAQKIIDCKDSDGAKQLIKDLNDKITKEEIRFRKNEKQYKK